MNAAHRMLKLGMIAAICLLAVLMVPLAVGANVTDPVAASENEDSIYPWPEPASVGLLDVGLAATGPYARYNGSYQYYSQVVETMPPYTHTAVLMGLELKDQLSSPTSVTARGYCAEVGQSADPNRWLPYCGASSGRVTYILGNYFPNTSAPVSAGGVTLNNTQKVAAVQSAIWYFSDGMVLQNGANSPAVYQATQDIIAAALGYGGSGPVPSALKLTPNTERNDINDSPSHTVTARLTDGYGNGVPGKTIHFEVTRKGVKVEDTSAVTNAAGYATLTYTFTGTIGDEVITDSIYAWTNYYLDIGLRFCDAEKQDLLLVDRKEIPLEDMAYKEWVRCVDYEIVDVDYDVDCVEEETSFTYLVRGDDEPGQPLQRWALGLCNLTDTGHDVVRVQYAVADCDTQTPGAWNDATFAVRAPGDPANLLSTWSVDIQQSVAPGTCVMFRIVIDGLWEYTTVPWAQQAGVVCAENGSVRGPSCEPYEKPDCTITAPSAVCDGAINQDASTTPGYVAYSWTVDGGIIVSGQGTDSIVWSATPGATLIKLKVTVSDELGCAATCEKLVTVSPLPVVLVDDQEVCVDESVTLTSLMISSGDCNANEITYSWYMSNTVTGQWDLVVGELGSTLTKQMTEVGTFYFRVQACCGTCCAWDDAQVTVHPYPVVTMQGDEVCLNEPVTLYANVTDPGDCDEPNLSYTWYAVVGQVRVLLPNDTGPSLVVDTSIAGSQTFVVKVCCDQCCDEAQATVVVHPYPLVRLMPQEVCEDEPLNLNALVDSYGDCEPGQADITWYKKDAAGQWSQLAETTASLPVDTSTVGDFPYKIVVCCGDCCYEAETTVTVLPNPVVMLLGDDICLGEEATLTATVVDTGDCEAGEGLMSWYLYNAATLTWDLVPGETGETLLVTPTAAGTYDYRVRFCCDDCCDTADAQLVVDPLPVVVLIGDEVCIGSAATVTSDIRSAGDCEPAGLDTTWSAWNTATQQWDVLVGETGETLSVTPTAVGSYRFMMTVCCDGCCSEAETTVVVYPEPTCWIEGDTEGCAGVTFSYRAASGGVTYAWSVDGVLQTTGASSSFDWVSVAGSHVISVLITDANGCQSECSLPVTPAQPRLVVRKWHDLDGDGFRDLGEVPLGDFEFTIYDAQDNEIASGTTDAVKGEVSFLLDCGTYTVIETQKVPWINTTPMTQTISIDLSQELWELEFGNRYPELGLLVIDGFKFWDLNHNGRNDSEPWLEGFKVVIRDSANNLVAERYTDASGYWSYDGPWEVGIYTVREVVTSGWNQTYPTPNGGVYQFEVYRLGAALQWRLLSAEPIDWARSLDFGNTRPMGFKWNDRNANGRVDPAEPMLGNWRIVMKDMAFNIVHDTRTVAGYGDPYFGYWFLTRPLPAGEYYVVEEPLPGWQQTYPGYGGYKIYLYADGSYDLLSAPLPWRDGLSFGNWLNDVDCPVCVDRVVFQSDRTEANMNIFTMDMDGGDVRQLTESKAADVSPSWNYVESAITFASNRDGDWEIYRMDKDGVVETNVTNMPGSDDTQPNWSCDWITFQSNRDGNWEIYKVDPDAPTVQIRLTENAAADVAPYWSPDETKIAFQSNRDGNWEIYVMSAEGEDVSLQRITDNLAADRNPAWLLTQADADDIRNRRTGTHSKWLVFESDRDHTGQFDLYKVHVDTGELVQLTTDLVSDMDAAGAPYCDYIMFETARDGRSSDVWRMRHDGTEQTNITLNDLGPGYWFDAIDQMPDVLGWIDPGPLGYRYVVPLILRP